MSTLYKHNVKILFYSGLGELALFPKALPPALLVLLRRCRGSPQEIWHWLFLYGQRRLTCNHQNWSCHQQGPCAVGTFNKHYELRGTPGTHNLHMQLALCIVILLLSPESQGQTETLFLLQELCFRTFLWKVKTKQGCHMSPFKTHNYSRSGHSAHCVTGNWPGITSTWLNEEVAAI